ncbi:exocyst complex component 7-like isoform X1 [Dreissena polymorpha]|uniref:exocyst complex component 7-like isoform X1 n=1 Tax=Dreissena polymorpha TaxID=45954 RepID=UPI002264A7E8|nr:exocyst complex component 7-like isoform X1 [Dreissena polymorpha]
MMMVDISNMEDISHLKFEINSKLEKEMSNLTLLKDSLKKSNNNTENMLGILTSFETRLRKLEQTIVPVYNETENLRRRQENIEKTMTTLDHVLGYYHIAQEADMMIKDGPELHGLDRYLQQMDKVLEALVYFKKHNQNTVELRDVAGVFEQGKDALQIEFQTLLARHGRPVPAVVIIDCVGVDDDTTATEAEVQMEHLPEKVIEDLSDISRWLITNGNSTDFLKDYIQARSGMLVKSLSGLRDHLKTSSGTSVTMKAPHSPALAHWFSRKHKPSGVEPYTHLQTQSSKFSKQKDTPGRKSIKGLGIKSYTKKASTVLLKSPFDPGYFKTWPGCCGASSIHIGHRRTGSTSDALKEDSCEVDIDVYITELSALLKLMQSELQLLTQIIPEKYQRTVYDNIVQPGLEVVVTAGETLASFTRKNIGKREFNAVLSIFPVVKHLRSIKPDFDRNLEGCQAPTRAKLASLLSTLGSTGAKGLEEFIDNIRHDPDKSSNMPRDGTVHELTNQTMVFMEQLQDYIETAGAMLLMHDVGGRKLSRGELAASSEAVDDRKSRLKLADYCSKVLSALGLNLSNKSETYSDAFIKPIFMLNNFNYILKSLKRSGLIELVHLWNKDVEMLYKDQIMEQKKSYSQSWSRVMHYIMEINEPMSSQRMMNPEAKLKEKEKQNIKDKFTGFNKELEEIVRTQKTYAIPDVELRAAMKKDNVEYIIPLYRIFLEKYRKMNFTKNLDKYVKYSVEDVQGIIEKKLFDTSA